MGDPRSCVFVMGDNESFTTLLRGGAAEAIGVFLFVFTGCGAAISVGGGLYPIAFAFGLAIMVLVFATADISGGHLNPAVTLALLAAGKVAGKNESAVTKSVVYIMCQCAGAIFVEIITTFTLVITIFGNAVYTEGTANHVAPIPIGFAVVLGILATGNLSGGSMNPARSLGPAVAAGYWHSHYVYWVGPIIGGVLAGLLWKFVFAKPESDDYSNIG